MKKLLILGAPIFQIPIIKKAKEMGFYVGTVDINENALAFPFADEHFVASVKDNDAILEIAKQFKPDGIVIGACDTPVRSGAYVCEKLGLPGNSIEASINSTDKVKMLEAFVKYGVPHPKFQVIRKENINNFVMEIPYPAISKPIDLSGSRGICKINNENELQSSINFSSTTGQSGDVLVEEYMEGPEVSVEVIVYNGRPYVLQITDKMTSGEPNFYEIGHSQPSNLNDDVKDKIKEVASKAVLAVGLVNSPAHVEIKVTKDGPKMIELGARMGGDCITTYLIDNSVEGINMAETAIKLALSEKIDVSNYKNSGICSAVRFIPAKKGVVKSITGVEESLKQQNVVDIGITTKIGEKFNNISDNSARYGYVVCTGKSTEEALNSCQKVINRINIEVEN